jgi:hypothetical protein
VGTNKRGADARRVRDAEALLDRRYFVLDPERWAASSPGCADASEPALKKLLQKPSVFERADARK